MKLEQYFLVEEVPEDMKVKVVMLSLDGDALQWHQYYQSTEGGLASLKWEMYLEAMKERFAGDEEEDYMSALVELRQDGSVVSYYQKFIRTLNQLQVPTQHSLSIFLSNLKLEMKQQVRVHKPKTLTQAFTLAKQFEGIIFPQRRFNGPLQKNSP